MGMSIFRIALVVLLGTFPLFAQDLSTESAPAETLSSPTQSTIGSLEMLQRSIQQRRSAISNLTQRIEGAQDDHPREDLTRDLDRQRRELSDLMRNFNEFALGIDVGAFMGEEPQPFDLQQELEKLLQPIVGELQKATAASREIEALRERYERMANQAEIASNAVANVDTLLAADPPEALRTSLNDLRQEWQNRYQAISTQAEGLRMQLEGRLATRKSLVENTRAGLQTFFRTRGLNVFMGVLAFCIVFFGMRGIHLLYRRIRPLPSAKSFSSRALQLAWHIATALFAILAMLLVFNLVGDWFLLGILILFLLAVAWASINTIPQHVERIKLMLNIGPVKEEEFIHFDGILWKVESIGFWASLVNPLLEGGRQMILVDNLIGRHSRPPGPREELFPCRAGDWVTLDDGCFGRVVYQTPRMVQVVELGGAQKMYQTEAFLALNPKTLSTGFRIETTFGIDYRHQAECTTTIPDRMHAKLKEGLPGRVDEKSIKNISVTFTEAGSSSLDYRVAVDFDGAVANRRPLLQDAIKQLLVDACNENGWEIPFQQITLHQASKSGPSAG